MEIRLKTADEFRDAHVTIEIRAADQHEAQKVLDGAPSFQDRQKVIELERGRKADHDEIVALRQKAEMFKAQAYSENDRAGRERQRADKAEAELARRTGERDGREKARADLEQENAWLHKMVQQVNLEVHGPEILAALSQVARNPEQSDTLANAVREVRQIVTAPRPETSQA